MILTKRKVFISYYHADDQRYKEALCRWNEQHEIFIDKSVDTGDIDESLPHASIRRIIRDQYLRDSSVTILLAGPNTAGRKHVDWELYSSMYNGSINKQSGILVINLPETRCEAIFASHGIIEKKEVYPEYKTESWYEIDTRSEHESRYPHLSDRIIDNLTNTSSNISVTSWNKITQKPHYLRTLIELTAKERANNNYDLKRPMRHADSPLPNPFSGLFA